MYSNSAPCDRHVECRGELLGFNPVPGTKNCLGETSPEKENLVMKKKWMLGLKVPSPRLVICSSKSFAMVSQPMYKLKFIMQLNQ